MNLKEKVFNMIENINPFEDISREEIIEKVLNFREAIITKNGALATWTEVESTGRSPKDTVTVKRDNIDQDIDWSSPNNIPITEETFDMLFEDALQTLQNSKSVFITNRVIGADSSYALPVKTISNSPLTALFTLNMFRKIPEDISKSIFYNKEFILLALPYDKIESKKVKKYKRE